MADGITTQTDTPATIPGATKIATDDAGAAGHVQVVKLAIGTDGSATPIPADGTDGLLVKLSNPGDIAGGGGGGATVRRQVTPTVSTSPAYTAKDAVGGLMEFTNAAASSGGAIRVVGVEIADKGQQRADLDLVLFDRTITAPTDNAVFDPTDTELAYVVGIVPTSAGAYSDFNDNSVLSLHGVDITAVLNGTSIFGMLVARGTPTYTSTSDLTVSLTIEQL